MNKQDLIDTVEMCWQVACEARISFGPMDRGFDACGQPVMDAVRREVFMSLLNAAVPHDVSSTVTVNGHKEPWQE